VERCLACEADGVATAFLCVSDRMPNRALPELRRASRDSLANHGLKDGSPFGLASEAALQAYHGESGNRFAVSPLPSNSAR